MFVLLSSDLGRQSGMLGALSRTAQYVPVTNHITPDPVFQRGIEIFVLCRPGPFYSCSLPAVNI